MCEVFINKRFKEPYLFEVQDFLDSIIKDLNIDIVNSYKIKEESVVFDSNYNLDKWWE